MSVTISVDDLKREHPEWREIFDYARDLGRKYLKDKTDRNLELNNCFFILKNFFYRYEVLYDSNLQYQDETLTFIQSNPEAVEEEILKTWREKMDEVEELWKKGE